MHEVLTVVAVAALTMSAYLAIVSAPARAGDVNRSRRSIPRTTGSGRPVPAAVYVEAAEYRKAS
jgi:hypothetical protein